MDGLHHRFAVILAADCAYYCRQVEQNAEEAVAALRECKDTFFQCVQAHEGREFGSAGDSLMAEFASPVEALRAARDFQVSNCSRSEQQPAKDPLQFRVGLHEGDILAENGNLYGDVINIAARLQQLAAPGGIVISSLVYEHVRKEDDLFFRPLGSHLLRNIEEPVAAYEIRTGRSRINWRRVGFKLKEFGPAILAALIIIFGVMVMRWYADSQTTVSPPIDVPAEPAPADDERSSGHASG